MGTTKRLLIKRDPIKGRGVYSKQSIRKGSIIEVCELIFVDFKNIKRNVLDGYAYLYTNKTAALALGNGSLYNHSDSPNAAYFFEDKRLFIEALKTIKPHEEITIDYGYSKENRKRFGLV